MKTKTKLWFIILSVMLLLASSAYLAFAADGITVSFYDGEELLDSVTVAEGEIPSPTTPDEVTVIDGVGYRFLGWTDTEGSDEIIDVSAAVADASYYAVRSAVAYKVESTDGTVVWHEPGVLLSEVAAASADGDIITAYSDVDIDSAIFWDKSVTLNLNGNTISTTGYLVPDGNAYITVKNGTVDITARELAQLYEGRSGNTTLALSDITVKKGASAQNKYLLDVRVGSVVMDGVTVNSGEWNIPSSSANAFITTGYRTKQVSQPINFTFTDCNITLPSIPFISASGASGETNGYALDIDINDSYIYSASYILNLQPADTAIANCSLDMSIGGASTLIKSTGFTNQVMFNINKNMNEESVVIRADYGVKFSKLPRIAVGKVLLGDGDDILDYDTDTTYGVVADLWADDYTPVTDYEYSFCIVGDTQMTVDYDPDYLNILYDWIIENKDAKKMKYVFGMGDITNHSAADEWQLAYNEISKLDGVIDYALIRGNHDTSEGFNATFNNDTYKSYFDGFYSEDLIENAYVAFNVGDVKYLHLTLDWRASDAVLSWASGIISKYYDHRVIISTHAYLSSEGSLLTEGNSAYGTTNSGEQMWNKLISQHENVFLVLSGHVFTTELVCLQSKGVHGNTVTQLVTNGQTLDYRNGAVGLVSMLYFSEDGKTVNVEYYSTVYDKHLGDNSQFTLTVPEYTAVEPEESDYLYSVTHTDGTVNYYDSTYNLSDIMTTYATNGCLISVYGDISVNAGFKVTKYISLNLNGYKITSDGGKIQGANSTLNITNGKIEVTSNNFLYIGEGYRSTVINLSDVEVTHTTTATSVAFADLRGGTLNLDNVRVTASGWNNLNASFITAGYRTKIASQSITVNLKNSSIDLGSGSANLIGFTGHSSETYGWCGNLTITGSDIAVGGYVVQATPSANAAANCQLNISFDGTSTIVSDSFFNVADTIAAEKISITFGVGAKLSSVPTVSGVTISYSDGVVSYDDEQQLYVVTSMASCGCMLVDANGDVYLYYESLSFTKELVELAQNAGCSIVLLQDMEMPAGTSTSSSGKYAITAASLTVDLNGHTLTMLSYAVFTTNKTTQLTIKNGTIDHYYTVWYSYSGEDSVTSCTFEGVTFIGRQTYAAFDHRIGTLSLTDCTFEFKNKPTSATSIFGFGYVNNATNKIYVELTDCTIDATAGSEYRSIFKLYGGRPVTLEANGCTFSVGSSAYLVHAVSSYTTAPTDTLSFVNCEMSKSGENAKLLSIAYNDMNITLDEVYVPCGSSLASDNATVSYAQGQTMATVASGGYKITKPLVSPKANLTLYSDFDLNLWFSVDDPITMLKVGDTVYNVNEQSIHDGFYKFVISKIAPNSAAEELAIEITYTDGEESYTVILYYSIIRYAQDILSGTYSEEANALVAYAVAYINSAYEYSGAEKPSALSELISSEAYTAVMATESADAVTAVPESQTSVGNAGMAIDFAQLYLGSKLEFLFTLNSEYTGALTLSYSGNDYVCEVVNGEVDGEKTVSVNMRAFDFYDGIITISSDGEILGTYDLKAYISGVGGENAMLDSLLLDMYNYCKEADEYKAIVSADGKLD